MFTNDHLIYALKPTISQTLLDVGYIMMNKTMVPAFKEFIVHGGEIGLQIAMSTLKEKYSAMKKFLTEIGTTSEVYNNS